MESASYREHVDVMIMRRKFCFNDKGGQRPIVMGWTPKRKLWNASRQTKSHLPISAFLRWDEKAGLHRDAIRSQGSTRSRRKEKETGDEED
jgi:hypothetical protein